MTKNPFAWMEGGDDSQRLFSEEEVLRYRKSLSDQTHESAVRERLWWETAKPGDMFRVKNGGYFPGTDIVIILLGDVTQLQGRP